jgi:hypothetical protein
MYLRDIVGCCPQTVDCSLAGNDISGDSGMRIKIVHSIILLVITAALFSYTVIIRRPYFENYSAEWDTGHQMIFCTNWL